MIVEVGDIVQWDPNIPTDNVGYRAKPHIENGRLFRVIRRTGSGYISIEPLSDYPPGYDKTWQWPMQRFIKL